MKKYLRKIRIVALLLAVMMLVSSVSEGVSLAWFGGEVDEVHTDKVGGSLLTQYFHCGKGTADDPFVITRPVHYYNLVNLYQRVHDYSDKEYFFQVGYDQFATASGGYYVYAYDDKGNPILDSDGNYTYTTTLNLAQYSGANALLPIGTHDKNFRGHFDGKGITIANLTITGDRSDLGEEVDNVCDIGIFGFVTENSSITDAYFDNITIDLTSVTNVVSEVSGTQIHRSSAHVMDDSGEKVAYVGYLVGHIMQPSVVSGTYVNNVKIVGGNAATDNFGYFGCVENDDGTVVQTLGESIGQQFGSGDENGWGGTVDMKQLRNRVYDIARIAERTDDPEYPSDETIVMEDDRLISRTINAYDDTVQSTGRYSFDFHVYKSDVAGSYYFNSANGYSNYQYLTGLNQYQQKTVNLINVKSTSEKKAYYISDESGKNFIGMTAEKAIANTTKTNATKWTFESDSTSGSKVYTVGYTINGTQAQVVKYYLNRSDSALIVGTDDTAATIWKYATDSETGDPEIYTEEGGKKYYITFKNVWQVSTEGTTYSICDSLEEGHYLSTDGSQVTTETDSGTAVAWTLTEYTSAGKTYANIWTKIGGQDKYLAFEDGVGLCIRGTEFSWEVDVKSTKTSGTSGEFTEREIVFKHTSTGAVTRTWYLEYDSGWKAVLLYGNIVSTTGTDGQTHILTANNQRDGVIDGSVDTYSSYWQIDGASKTPSIALCYDGKSYYLTADTKTGQASLSQTETKWNKETKGDTTHFYIVDDGIKYYLEYKNGWIVEADTKYQIYYDDATASETYYMMVDLHEDSLIGKLPASEISEGEMLPDTVNWQIKDVNAACPIYAVVENQYYYLCGDAATKELTLRSPDAYWSASDATQWQIDYLGRRYCVINGDNYYIGYDRDKDNGEGKTKGGWVLVKIYFTYESASKFLAVDSNKKVVPADKSAGITDNVKWEEKQGLVWTVVGGEKYYLNFAGENATPVLSKDNQYVWDVTVPEGKTYAVIRSTAADGSCTLVCLDDGWITVASGLKSIKDQSGSNYLAITSEKSGKPVLGVGSSATSFKAMWQSESVQVTHRWDGSKETATRFSITYKGTKYYLGNSGVYETLALVTDVNKAIKWCKKSQGYCYYPADLATPWYLLFDTTFTMRPTSWHNIKRSTDADYLTHSYSDGKITYGNAGSVTSAKGKFHTTLRSAAQTDIYYYRGNKNETGVAYYLGWDQATQTLTYTKAVEGDTRIMWNHDTADGKDRYYIEPGKYLLYDDFNYNYWTCRTDTGYRIKHNSKQYLGISKTWEIATNSSTVWTFTGSSGRNGKLSAYVKGKTLYANNNGGTLEISEQDLDTFWHIDTARGTIYSMIGDCKYYLVYDDAGKYDAFIGWKLVNEMFTMKDPTTGKYMYINSSGKVSNTAKESSATTWMYDAASKQIKGYRSSLGKTYYLTVSGNSVSISKTVPTTKWKKDSNDRFYVDSETSSKYQDNLYISFENSKWVVMPDGSSYIKSGGATLSATGQGTSTTTSDGGQRWLIGSDGSISTYVSGTKYYLNNTSGKITLDTTNSTTWTYSSYYGDDHKAYSSVSGGKTYYLTYDPDGWVTTDYVGWQLAELKYLISSTNTSGKKYYFPNNLADGRASSFAGAAEPKDASRWTAVTPTTSKNPSGQFMTTDTDGEEESTYLGWTTRDGFASRTFYYYIGYDKSWTNTNSKVSFYSSSWWYGDYTKYLSLSGSEWTLDDTGTVIEFVPSVNHCTTEAQSITDSAKPSTKVNIYSMDFGDAIITDAVSEADWEGKAAVTDGVPDGTGELIQRTYCEQAKYVKNEDAAFPSISVSTTVMDEPQEVVSTRTMRHAIRTIETQGQEVQDVQKLEKQRSGYATYIPLRLDVQNDDDKTSYYSDYRVSPKNTGYIVSGSNDDNTSSPYRADIRISNWYDTSDIGKALNISRANTYSDSLDKQLQVLTQTSTSGGLVLIQDSHNGNYTGSIHSSLRNYTKKNWQDIGLTKYESSDPTVGLTREAFKQMLLGGSTLYGLHFMDSQIQQIPNSKGDRSHIIYADQVTILGNTYYNYELPEDAIDFSVPERGAINFFAGTYYNNDVDVDSFFSLHHIQRDANKHITSIKQIDEIYQKKKNGAYTYKYTDGSYSDGSDGSTLTPDKCVFKLDWIGKRNDLLTDMLYYFEIPVNRGEYALGSVEDGTGAYLLYLDIATNGGGSIEDRISSEGSGIFSAMQMDYRTPEQVKVESGNSLMQFALEVPEGDNDKVSVHTQYYGARIDGKPWTVPAAYYTDPDKGRSSVTYDSELNPMPATGLYVITIVNKSDYDINLTVFLCDDDADKTNEYPYAYQIRYINKAYDEEETLMVDGKTNFKSCYEYVIPHSSSAF